jgi:hypothetical protein
MKKILLSVALSISLLPAMADTLTDEVAESYSKVVDGWTYITNAAEFRLLAQQCQSPDVEEKKIRLACDIEYPSILYRNKPEYYIKYFRGTFDGMGCTIKKFHFWTTEDSQDNVGFIQELKGTDSKVCNLRFDDCDIDARNLCTMAVVVSKITANKADLNNILIKRGSILARQNGIFGCLAGSINSYTTISHCAIDSLDVSRVGDNQLESNPVGIFASRMIDDGDVTKCSIHDCYMASTPLRSNLYAKFSIITTYTSQEINKGKYRHSNCFWDNTSFVRSVSTNDFFTNDKDNKRLINVTTLEQLKSGNDVLNDADGWMCQKDSLPKPVGLFYWNPKKSYSNIRVGTYGSSNVLMGEVTPVDYCHYIEPAQLKLTAINAEGATDYVLDDRLSNDIGVESAIVTLGENVLYGIDMNTLQLPGEVTAIEGTAFPHNVSQAFVTHGNWRFAGNMLYLITKDMKRLVATIGDDEEMTIDCRYCTSILDEVFMWHTNLRRLYVNTWFPTDATTFTPVQLLGNNVFYGCSDELEVYVKDGTTDQLIIGTDIDTGYKKMNCGWDQFYSENEDVPNRLFRYFPVTRNPAKLSTIMLGYPVELPADCKAWVATTNNADQLILKRVRGNILPAMLPVLLSYEETSGVMHLSPYEGNKVPSATLYEGSIFKGSIDPAGHQMDASEMMSNFYTLSRRAGSTDWSTVAFRPFHPTDNILPSYIAYISSQDVPQNCLFMIFSDHDFTNGIDVIDEGQLLDEPSGKAERTVNNEKIYNLNGQRVGTGYRGMIIKNGRKFIVR